MAYVTNGLLLYFNGKGKTNPSTTWEDLSGNNHNAALSGFAGTVASGWTGEGLAYDGSNDVAKIASYSPMATDGDFTLELYFQTSVPTTQQRLTAFGSSTRFYFQINSDGITIGLGGGYLPTISTTYLPTANTKTHYILTRSGTNYALWKNGTKVASGTTANQGAIVTGSGYILGASYEGDGYLGLNGIMYANRWYNRALTDAEISQNYNDATSTVLSPTVTPPASTSNILANTATANIANIAVKSALTLTANPPTVYIGNLIYAVKSAVTVTAVTPKLNVEGDLKIIAAKAGANIIAQTPLPQINIPISKALINVGANNSLIKIEKTPYRPLIALYDAKATDFSNNGLVVLNECKSCYIIQELNGAYTLELEYPKDSRGKYTYLEGFRIIKADGQLFRIPMLSKVQEDSISIKITANHIFYDLINDFLEDNRAVGVTVNSALTTALSNSSKFTIVSSDMTNTDTAYFVKKNPVEAVFIILDRWGGELYRNNYQVGIKSSIGNSNGVLISYGKNIRGFEQSLDYSQIVTKMMPTGKNGLTIDLVNGGSKYLISPKVNDYPFTITKEVQFPDIEDATELKNAALDMWGVIDFPIFNYKVDFLELSNTDQYRNFQALTTINLGDTVIIRHSIFGIDITAKVIKIKKNILTGKIEGLELGQFLDGIADYFKKRDKKTDTKFEVIDQDVQDTKTTVSQTQEQIDLQAQDISNINTDINDLDTRVSNAELKITPSAIVSTVTSSTTYKNDISGLDSRLDSAEQKITADAIVNTVTSSTKYTNDINGLDSRMDSAELKITSSAIVSTVRSSTEYTNDLGQKITASQASTIAQTASNVQIGFNNISNVIDMDSTGLQVNHSDGSYSKLEAGGLKRYVSGTGKTYHYLSAVGTCIVPTSTDYVTVSLPSEFRGKTFSVVVSLSQVNNWTAGYVIHNFAGDVSSYDYNNGQFTIHGGLEVINIGSPNTIVRIDEQLAYIAIA